MTAVDPRIVMIPEGPVSQIFIMWKEAISQHWELSSQSQGQIEINRYKIQ